ncbi:hypothetical protein LCGC14_0663180 [marine sediment metagenome]|uniref:Uncharacterized protein n=1 Tax=marine sediment metagenome TaxID=412755 RepID=A0A0F9QT10_9ZZZZ
MEHIAYSCTTSEDEPDCIEAWCEKHHGCLMLCAVCNQAEAELEPTCPGPGVAGSAVRRIADLMKQLGFKLLRVEDAGHPSRCSMVFDDGDRCITTITCEDKEK